MKNKTIDKRYLPPSYGNLYHFLSTYNKALKNELSFIAGKHKGSALRLADAGCGTMPYRSFIESLGMQYRGGDLFDVGEGGFEIKEDGNFQLADNTTDIVLSSFVLEHAIDYRLHLRECNRVCAEGGLLVIATHGHWYYHPAPNDYWRFTSEGLKKEINDAGWEIQSFRGMMSMNAFALQILQDNTRDFLRIKLLTAGYTWFMQKLVALTDGCCKQAKKDKDSVAYIVVARKRG